MTRLGRRGALSSAPVVGGGGGGTDYSTEVLADSPLGFWKMQDASGTQMFDWSPHANHGTYVGSPDLSSNVGPGLAAPAATFNADGAAHVAVDLSGTNAATLEFWLWWDAFSDSDQVLFEYTPDTNSGAGFIINPNSSSTHKFETGSSGGTHFRTAATDRPSAAAWHHYSVAFDRTTVGTIFIDGVAQTIASGFPDSSAVVGNFDNSSLYFMARNDTIAPGHGRLYGVALFDSILSDARRQVHALAAVS